MWIKIATLTVLIVGTGIAYFTSNARLSYMEAFSYAMGIVAVSSAVVARWNVDHNERQHLKKLQEARDLEWDKLEPIVGSRVQETSIELHAQKLEIDRLRMRALASFVPGVLLCLSAVWGPAISYFLAKDHSEHWQYVFGGSTVALVLLAAGTALLRHDNKVREQIQGSQSELIYFSRIKTGLDCARVIGDEEYRRGLAVVVRHLLAEPPKLEAKAIAE